MSKNILVLPGTLWQVPLIEKIQESRPGYSWHEEG